MPVMKEKENAAGILNQVNFVFISNWCFFK